MMQKINRLISVILILSMLLSSVPMAAFAQDVSEELPAEVTEAPAPAEEIPAEPEPVYEEPVYEEPIYEEPVYEEPVYEEPAYEAPAEEVTVSKEPPAPEETNENPAEPEAPAEVMSEPAAESTEVQPEIPAEPEVQPAETEAAPAEKQINEIYSEIYVKADRLNSCLKLENVWAGYSKEKNTLAFHLTGDNGRVTFYVPVLFDEEEKAAPWTVTGEDLKKLPEQRIILIQGDSEGSLKGTKNLTPEWVGDLQAILVDLAGHGGDRELRELAVTECTLPQPLEEPAPAAEQPAEEAPAAEVPAAENTPEEKPAEEPIPAGNEEPVTEAEQPAEEVPAAEAPAEETPEQPEPEAAEENIVEVPAEKPLRFAAEEILLHVGDTLTPEIVNTEGKATLMGLSSETEAVRLEGETLTALSEGETTVFLASADPLEIADMIPVRVVADEVEIPETVTEAEDTAPHFARTEEHLAVGETLTLDVVNPENKTVLVGLSGDTNAVLWDEETRTLTALSDGEVTAILTTVDPLEVTSLAVVRIGGETPEVISAEAETLLRNDDLSAAPEGFEPEMMAGLRLDREYLALSAGDEIQLHIQGIPEDLEPYAQISWTVENRSGEEDRSTVDVDENGNITAAEQKSGYGIVTAVVTIGEYEFKARCRVDVMPKVSSAVTNASLTSNKATTELYQTAYTKIKIVLEFPQNWGMVSSMSTNNVYNAPRMAEPNMGSAIKSARFADTAAAEYFYLRVADDRTLEIIPTENAIENPKSVKGSYKSAIILDGDRWQATTDVLTLTVKKTLPKIKAKDIKFNSFIAEEYMPLIFTGADVTFVRVDSAKVFPDWLFLENNGLRLTADAKDAKLSAKVSLLLSVKGYSDSAEIPVTVNVSAVRTAPKITVKPAVLTLNPAFGDSLSTTASVSIALDDDQISVSSVKLGKTECLGEYIDWEINGNLLTFFTKPGFDNSTAKTFNVTLAVAGVDAGKVTIKTLASKSSPSITVKAAGTINTEVDGSPMTLNATAKNFTPAGYDVAFSDVYGDSADEFFSFETEGNIITVIGKTGLIAGTYYALVTAKDQKDDDAAVSNVKFTVKTDTKAAKSAVLKVKGSLDPIRPSVSAVVTATLKNWYGHELAPEDLVFYHGTGKKALPFEDGEDVPFDIMKDGDTLLLFINADVWKQQQLDPKTAKFSIGMKDADGIVRTASPVALNVKMGAAKLVLDPAKPELLRNDFFDSTVFSITSSDGTLSAVRDVQMTENVAFAFEYRGNGRCVIRYADEKIAIPAKTKSVKLSLKVWLEGNNSATPNASLTLPLSIVETKVIGDVEREIDYRRLSATVLFTLDGEPVEMNTPSDFQWVTFRDRFRNVITRQADEEPIWLSYNIPMDKILRVSYIETDTKIVRELTNRYDSIRVDGHDLIFLVEADAQNSSTTDSFTYEAIDGTTCRVSKYNGNADSVVIPSVSPEGLTVIEIGESAFEDNKNIRQVTFPSTIKTIKNRAFMNDTNLEEVTFAEGIEVFEELAFENCNLHRVDFPNSVTRIDSLAFAENKNLSEIIYPKNWTIPDPNWRNDGPFVGCDLLTSVIVPEGVTIIPRRAFSNTESLKEIILPNTLQEIGEGAFQQCTNLTSIILPESLKKIGVQAFRLCEKLSNIVFLGESIQEIGYEAFSDCLSLTHIRLPKNIETNASYLFDRDINLTNVNYSAGLNPCFPYYNLPVTTYLVSDSVVSITDSYGLNGEVCNLFAHMPNLSTVYLPGSLTYIFDRALDVVPSLSKLYCPYPSYAWDWAVENGYGDFLISWNGADPNPTVPAYDVMVSGNVRNADEVPIPGVMVTVQNAEDQYYTAYTDQSGYWQLTLTNGVQYSINYGHAEYIITAQYDSFIASEGLILTASSGLSSVIDPLISFTMSQNGVPVGEEGILVGTNVDFTVTAPESADMVRLVADGLVYEEYVLQNNTVSLSRPFSSAGNGTRKIQFESREEFEWKKISPSQDLKIRTNGKMDAPGIHVDEKLERNRSLTVGWDAVEHAESYTVYVYADGSQRWPYRNVDPDRVTGLSYTVPGEIFNTTGIYSIQVNTVGEGYESSTGYADVEVADEFDYGDESAVFTVTVYSPIHTPMNGTKIMVSDPGDGYIYKTVSTDVNGVAVISGLCQGKDYRFECSDPYFTYTPIEQSAGSSEESITFTAEASDEPYLIPSPKSQMVEQNGSSAAIRVTSSDVWTAESSEDWLTLDRTSGGPGDTLTVTASANEYLFRTGEISFTMGDQTVSAYLHQAGVYSKRLSTPTITYPAADNDEVPFGDIRVTWESVEGAESYVISMRDLDTKMLLINHEQMGTKTEAVLDSIYFTDSAKYRVAVGAVPKGASSSDSVVGWSERIFTVPEHVSDGQIVFTMKFYEATDPSVINSGTDSVNPLSEPLNSPLDLSSVLYSSEDVIRGQNEFHTGLKSDGNQTIKIKAGSEVWVDLYHFNTKKKTWEGFGDEYSGNNSTLTITGPFVVGERYRFMFRKMDFSFKYSSIDIVAAEGVNDIGDVLYWNSELSDQVNAMLEVEQYNIREQPNGLFAEYFAYDDGDNSFSAKYKRNEGVLNSANVSWISEYHSGFGYWELKQKDEESKGSQSINYVPFKFAARFNGYLELRGLQADYDAQNGRGKYKFRISGDDKVKLSMKLSDWDKEKQWDTKGWKSKAELDLSKNSYYNGTVFKIQIDYYNKNQTYGKANLKFEYQVDDGNWQVVPADWLYYHKNARITQISAAGSLGVDYIEKLAEVDVEYLKIMENSFKDLMLDLVNVSVDGYVNKYVTGGTTGEFSFSSNVLRAPSYNRMIGIPASQAFYHAVFFPKTTGNKDVDKNWKDISAQLKSEFHRDFNPKYYNNSSTIDSIETIQYYLGLMNEAGLSDQKLMDKANNIKFNYTLILEGNKCEFDFDLVDYTADTLDSVFDLGGFSAIVSIAHKGIDIINLLYGDDANTNRATLTLLYAEQNGVPDILNAAARIVDSGGVDLFTELLFADNGCSSQIDTRSGFENFLNKTNPNAVVKLEAARQGVNLDKLLYMDLLKSVLDAAKVVYSVTF